MTQFIGGMRDKNTSVGAGFAHFDRQDSFKIDDGMWDEKQNITRYLRYTKNWLVFSHLHQF